MLSDQSTTLLVNDPAQYSSIEINRINIRELKLKEQKLQKNNQIVTSSPPQALEEIQENKMRGSSRKRPVIVVTEEMNEMSEFDEDQEQETGDDWNAILGMTTDMAIIVDGKVVDNQVASPMVHTIRDFQLNKPFPAKNVQKAAKNECHHSLLLPP